MGIRKFATMQKITNKNPVRDELKINFNFKFWNEPLDYPNRVYGV
jgi:hypothetical protein